MVSLSVYCFGAFSGPYPCDCLDLWPSPWLGLSPSSPHCPRSYETCGLMSLCLNSRLCKGTDTIYVPHKQRWWRGAFIVHPLGTLCIYNKARNHTGSHETVFQVWRRASVGRSVCIVLMLSLSVELPVPTNLAISTLADAHIPAALQCPRATQDEAIFFM